VVVELDGGGGMGVVGMGDDLDGRRCLMQSEMVQVSFNLLTYYVPIV